MPPGERDSVFREAVESAPKKNGKAHVTAKHVQKVVAKRAEPDPAPEPAKPLDSTPWAKHNEQGQRVIDLMDEYRVLAELMADTPFGGWVDLKATKALIKSTRENFQKWQVVGFKPQWEIGKDGRNFYYAWEKKGSK